MERKILIAYYSHSSHTKKIASMIQHKVGGTLCEIQPEVANPTLYHSIVEQAKQEIQRGFYPPIKSKIENIEAYDTIFIGTPNWWNTMAPPIARFLQEIDLSGKRVIPFCTHGDGGRDADVQLSKWIEKIKMD